MDASCKDCTFVVDLRRDVDGLKTDVEKIDNRLQDVEKTDAARNEQMKNFDKKLDEIGWDIKEIKTSRNKFFVGIISGVTITVIAAFILQTFKIFHW